jgi:indolepyruvate ferredoxin oxidoreductase
LRRHACEQRGRLPPAAHHLLINHEVCEGCGDCGVQSNCVAIVPKDTALGRKRAVDTAACNSDLRCAKRALFPFFFFFQVREKSPT